MWSYLSPADLTGATATLWASFLTHRWSPIALWRREHARLVAEQDARNAELRRSFLGDREP